MNIIICETHHQSRFDAWCRVLRAGALGWPWGMGWGGKWEQGSGWGTHVHPWLVHVMYGKKIPQYCKVNSLQLKKKKSLTRYTIWKYFHLFCGLSFHCLNFYEILLINLAACAFCVIYKKSLSNIRLQKLVPMSSSKSFFVSALLSRSWSILC